MLQNAFTLALRHFRKNFFYASLNTLGLAIGYAALCFIGVYLYFETSFEQFHGQADRIFRPTYAYDSGSDFHTHWARIPFDFINELPQEFPEVDQLIRFQNQTRKYIRIGQEKFRPEHVYTTDSAVFEVFDFPFIAGNPQTALARPHSIVLTESMAQTYFDGENPLGQTIYVIGEYTDEEVPHVVTGVMADLPGNTHLPVDLLISFENEQARTWWAYVYILLQEEADIDALEAQMPAFIRKFEEEAQAEHMQISFQALPDIHLHSHLAREIVPNGNAENVHVFFFVGLFILLIALINYLNLSNAQALGRSKEIGMRLILGVGRGQLIRMALVESVLYNLLAVALSLLLVWGLMPIFQQLSGTENLIPPLYLLGAMLLLAAICGLLAGLYPAWGLVAASSQRLLHHSKSFSLIRSSGFPWKRLFVGLQFCASILLVASAGVAWNQVRYLHDKQLGLEKSQVLAIPGIPNPVTDAYPTFRNQVSGIPGVHSIAACMEVPSREIRDVGPVLVQGKNQDPSQAPMMDMQVISPDFLETMGIELLAGKDRSQDYVFGPVPQFNEDYSPATYLNQQPRHYLINETAMRQLGWQTPEEAIGQQINWSIGGFELAMGPVTGVVRDYHQESLKNQVDPTVMVSEQIWLRTFLLKLSTQNIESTLQELEAVWDRLYPVYPLEYHFLDEMYDELYQQERRQLQLLMIFSGLAIFLALLGLFGLVAYSLRTRLREIAIRKVVGARLNHLVWLISREYLLVLFLSALVAIPLSYLWISEWLENFAYRVGVTGWVYALTLGFIASLLLLTVVLQIWRGSSMNPVHALREE